VAPYIAPLYSLFLFEIDEMRFVYFVLVVAVLHASWAANHDVQVGQTGLTFTPANVGVITPFDTITFHFITGGIHDVVILTGNTSLVCADPGTNGVDSCSWSAAGNCAYSGAMYGATGTTWVYPTDDTDASKTFQFLCTVHCGQNMTGTFIVGPSVPPPPSPAATTTTAGAQLLPALVVGLLAIMAAMGWR